MVITKWDKFINEKYYIETWYDDNGELKKMMGSDVTSVVHNMPSDRDIDRHMERVYKLRKMKPYLVGPVVYKVVDKSDDVKREIKFNITENVDIGEEIQEQEPQSNYDEVLDDLKEMIENTIQESGGEYNQFIEAILREPEDAKIEGFINDSDIYEFYLKYRNAVDQILNEVEFYKNSAEELNVFGLYDYVIAGTKEAVNKFVEKLSEE